MTKNFLYDTIVNSSKQQFEALQSAIESIEIKTGVLFTGIGVILALIGQFLLSAKAIEIFPFIFCLGILFLLGSLFISIITLWTRRFEIGIKIDKFYNTYVKQKQSKTKLDYLAIINKELYQNRSHLAEKGKLFNIALSLFTCGIILLFSSLIFPYTNERGWHIIMGDKSSTNQEDNTNQISTPQPTQSGGSSTSSGSLQDASNSSNLDEFIFDIHKGTEPKENTKK